ncbi:MAG: cobalt-precorrin-5B (C1)-methyltransferase [Candidatus Methanomethylophilaceae archaeon]|nr:cobalt-precorrin-5B (C1)-methyltransferase [Candidatus Methanomethylophilaceae archaeon]
MIGNGMYINVGGKMLRRGHTTGTCATAASKAAAEMLVAGGDIPSVTVLTPKGIALDLPVENVARGDGWVRCAVRKDGGDDIDVTDGSLVYSEVHLAKAGINIDGGRGVGRVTKGGLDQPVGAAAINRVPRRMISEALEGIRMTLGYDGGFDVIISIPNGQELAKRTFNPRLGIEGGISILGTSGIVEPMSERAVVDTIKAEMSVRKNEGCKYLLVVPGNYGVGYIESISGLDPESAVKCSNFIGETLDHACELGFEGLLLVGNLGKLVKLAGGIMNTHSREADARMEILAANAALSGASVETVCEIMECISTDDALEILDRDGATSLTMDLISKKIEFYMNHRTNGRMKCGAFVFSSRYGMVGGTPGAADLLKAMGGTL